MSASSEEPPLRMEGAAAEGSPARIGIPSRPEPVGLSYAGAAGLLLLLVYLQAVIGATLMLLRGERWLESAPALQLALLNALGALGVLWVGVGMSGQRARAVLRIAPLRPSLVPGILLVTWGLFAVWSSVPMPFEAPDWLYRFFWQVFGNGWLMGALLVVVVGPLAEELLFRGLILGGLRRRYGAPAAVAVSTFLFALIHLNLPQGLSAALLGVWCALAVLGTGSLLAGVLIHAVWNASASLEGMLGHGVLAAQAPQPQVPLWLPAAGALLVAGGILLLRRQLAQRGPAAPQADATDEAVPPRGHPGRVALVLLGPLPILALAISLNSRRDGPAEVGDVAGCYRLSVPAPLVLFDRSAGPLVQVRMTASPLAATDRRARYLASSIPAPAAAPRDTVYWQTLPRDSLRLVRLDREGGGVILRFKRSGARLEGTATTYARGAVSGGGVRVTGARMPCPAPAR